MVPAKDGISLILNPCENNESNISQIPFIVSVGAYHDSNSKTKLTYFANAFTDDVAIEFPKALLRQWDTLKNIPHFDDQNDTIPARVLFTPDRLDFTSGEGIAFKEVKNVCTPMFEITGTGLLIKPKGFLPDFYPKHNIEQINCNNYPFDSHMIVLEDIGETCVEDSALQNFMGVYFKDVEVTIPYAPVKTIQIYCTGRDFIIDNNSIRGVLELQGTFIQHDIFKLIKEEGGNSIELSLLIKELQQELGKVEVQDYTEKSSFLTIYFRFPN